jgi:hypothetical protein
MFLNIFIVATDCCTNILVSVVKKGGGLID